MTASALHLLQSVQIEHQGLYSTNRLYALQDYVTNVFTAKRLAVLLFVTPWPSVCIAVLLELFPLNSPSIGTQGNMGFWARFAAVNVVQTTGYIVMARVAVRLFQLSFMQAFCTVVCATAAAVATTYACSVEIGLPLPFTMSIGSIPWLIALWTTMGIFSFRRLFQDPVASLSLKEWFNVSGLVASQLFIYPLYNYVFRLASSWGQTGLSVVLGMIKIGYRFAVGNMIKQQADFQAEIVTFNAEIGHAMFVAFSMQNATSFMTIAVLLIVDGLHASSVVYEVHVMARRLEILDQAIRTQQNEASRACSVIDRADALIAREHADPKPILRAIRSQSLAHTGKTKNHRSKPTTIKTAKVRVVPSPRSTMFGVVTTTSAAATFQSHLSGNRIHDKSTMDQKKVVGFHRLHVMQRLNTLQQLSDYSN